MQPSPIWVASVQDHSYFLFPESKTSCSVITQSSAVSAVAPTLHRPESVRKPCRNRYQVGSAGQDRLRRQVATGFKQTAQNPEKQDETPQSGAQTCTHQEEELKLCSSAPDRRLRQDSSTETLLHCFNTDQKINAI